MTTLWIDLGNTRLKYWLIKQGQLLDFDAREHLKAPNELLLGLSAIFIKHKLTFIGVSSVLGKKINQNITETLSRLNAPLQFAKVTDQHPLLKSHYDPNELGTDRWLQMLGAVDSTKQQCVVGCGTALTIDIVDYGVHLGGYILPNAYMQRHALYAGTQQIGVKAGRFDSLSLGQNTFDAVNHGILFGLVAAVSTITHRYPHHQLILTGGGATTLAPHLSGTASICDDLLLTGLKRYFAHPND